MCPAGDLDEAVVVDFGERRPHHQGAEDVGAVDDPGAEDGNRSEVRGRITNALFILEVRDDGVGGADPEAGTGLLGLADRISVLDGRLLISAPAGGPTVLRVEIPCPLSA
jgi:hypothetical protein